MSWTCTAAGGAACSAASGSASINSSVNLPAGGSVTFTANATLAYNASGSVVNTATVTLPANATDPNTANNSATDTLALTTPTLPALTVRDNFNRANANTLGNNWSQVTAFGSAAIRVNSNQAFASVLGAAFWNVPTTGFGAGQAAAFTFANAPAGGSGLVLKVTGSSATLPTNFIRVQYQTTGGGQLTVATTTNGGLSYTTRGQTMTAAFVTGDTLAAAAYADGSVAVFKNGAFVGRAAGTGFTGTGRIGIQLPANARVDDFRGDTLLP